MAADGSDIVTMSYHDLPEYSPSVDWDGKIVYTRWDYYDKASHWTGNLWKVFPDGRDPRAPHGNYYHPHQTFDATRPDGQGTGLGNPMMEQGIRAVPGSPGLYTATVSAVHGGERGSLVLIDLNKADDYGMGQVSRLTPEIVFPESETFGKDNGLAYSLGERVYGYCWPLDKDFYLCAYGDHIYYLDRFGNRELIVAADEVPGARYSLADPIPLRPRPKPPVIPVQTYEGERQSLPHDPATIRIMNIYDADMPWPEGVVEQGAIKWLRVIQFFPKTEDGLGDFYGGYPGMLGKYAKTDYGGTNNTRMPLGVVPVEADGSVFFEAPIRKDIYFQALDADGMAIHSMRSATNVQAGEQLTCRGCHEDQTSAPPAATALPDGMRRSASRLQAETSLGIGLPGYHRLVQPVFERSCIPCHSERRRDGQTTGPVDMSYDALEDLVFRNRAPRGIGGRACMGSRTIPGHYGARASRMGRALLNPVHRAARKNGSISDDDFRRVVLWLDCNSPRYGNIHSRLLVQAQDRGEAVLPSVDFQPWNPRGLESDYRDTAAPPTVQDVSIHPADTSPLQSDLSWPAVISSKDRPVACYAIYRDDAFLDWSLNNRYRDHCPVQEKHRYQVAAFSRGGTEGPRSEAVTRVIDWDPSWPARELTWDPTTMAVTASSEGRGRDSRGRKTTYAARNTINGDYGSKWQSEPEDGADPWIDYDLGKPHRIVGLRLLNAGAIRIRKPNANPENGLRHVRIEGSMDGKTWGLITELRDIPQGQDLRKKYWQAIPSKAWYPIAFDTGATLRQLRITAIGNHGGPSVGFFDLQILHSLVPTTMEGSMEGGTTPLPPPLPLRSNLSTRQLSARCFSAR